MKATVIGVVLHYAVDYVREGIEGALSCIREQNSWRGRILTPADIRPGNRSLAPLDGLIGAFDAPEEVRVVQRLRIPTVNFSSNTKSSLPSVLTDNRAVGRIAARHLLDCGLHSFAYLASPSMLFSQERGEGFAAALRAAGRRLVQSGHVRGPVVTEFAPALVHRRTGVTGVTLP